MKVRIATRESRLAIAQTELVLGLLRATRRDLEIEVRLFATSGDCSQDTPIELLADGAFTDRIERALLDGEADAAVHSFKDLPARLPDGLIIAAVPLRTDPREALVSREGLTLDTLPSSAVVGVSSERRSSAIRARRPDIELRPIRGPVDSRVRKVDSGEYDATVLAVAGLERLGLLHRISQIFEISEIPPAAGQGALAVQCREGDAEIVAILRGIDEPGIHAAVTRERNWQLLAAS